MNEVVRARLLAQRRHVPQRCRASEAPTRRHPALALDIFASGRSAAFLQRQLVAGVATSPCIVHIERVRSLHITHS